MPKGERPPHTPATKLAAALSHPDRYRILIEMNSPVRRMSPNDFSLETGLALGSAAYHFRVLNEAGCVQLVEERRNRGAVEHIYEPVRRALAWTREYEKLPDIAKQNIDAVGLMGYVESVGNAIDAGLYCKRNESHVSQQRFWSDDAAFTEASELLDRTLEDLMAIEEKAAKRLNENPDAEKFLASYHMSLFETPPKSTA
jgi:DNA-binding transcriptional ArsR family regulator